MTPQAKKAAIEIGSLIYNGFDHSNLTSERLSDIIDRAFADVLRDRDELREALANLIENAGDCLEVEAPSSLDAARALLSK